MTQSSTVHLRSTLAPEDAISFIDDVEPFFAHVAIKYSTVTR